MKDVQLPSKELLVNKGVKRSPSTIVIIVVVSIILAGVGVGAYFLITKVILKKKDGSSRARTKTGYPSSGQDTKPTQSKKHVPPTQSKKHVPPTQSKKHVPPTQSKQAVISKQPVPPTKSTLPVSSSHIPKSGDKFFEGLLSKDRKTVCLWDTGKSDDNNTINIGQPYTSTTYPACPMNNKCIEKDVFIHPNDSCPAICILPDSSDPNKFETVSSSGATTGSCTWDRGLFVCNSDGLSTPIMFPEDHFPSTYAGVTVHNAAEMRNCILGTSPSPTPSRPSPSPTHCTNATLKNTALCQKIGLTTGSKDWTDDAEGRTDTVGVGQETSVSPGPHTLWYYQGLGEGMGQGDTYTLGASMDNVLSCSCAGNRHAVPTCTVFY